ncbi:hypothetical protein [Micromonospora sp. C81]
MVQVITAARPEWIFPFTGSQPARIRTLDRLIAEHGGASLTADRVGSRP